MFLAQGATAGKVGGRLKTTNELLLEARDRYDSPPELDVPHSSSTKRKRHVKPLPIIAERMSLPTAGARHRLTGRLSPFLALAQHRPELLNKKPLPRPVPRARFHGDRQNGLRSMCSLSGRGMVALVPPEWIAPDGEGKPVPGAGGFGVPKSDDIGRAITNLIPRNLTHLTLRTANLHHGSQFCSLRLEENKVMRVSLDDLPYYFHDLAVEDRVALCYHLGTKFKPHDLIDAGFTIPGHLSALPFISLALVALPMGSLHAADGSQGYHEGMICDEGDIAYRSLLHYGQPINLWGDEDKNVYHVLYIDGGAVVGVVDTDVAAAAAPSSDARRVQHVNRV